MHAYVMLSRRVKHSRGYCGAGRFVPLGRVRRAMHLCEILSRSRPGRVGYSIHLANAGLDARDTSVCTSCHAHV